MGAPPKTKQTRRTNQAFAKSLAARPEDRCLLRLYVAGASARSRQALLRIRKLCETELKGKYELEVVDIYQQPVIARIGQIVATPTLVREFPRPMRRLIGNLSDATGLIAGLDLEAKGRAKP